MSRAAAAGLKGIALVSPTELHSADPAASHASLRDGNVLKKTEEGWMLVLTVRSNLLAYSLTVSSINNEMKTQDLLH